MQEKNKSVLFIVEIGEGSARPLLRGELPAKGLRENGYRTKAAAVLYAEGKLKYGRMVPKGTYNGWNPGEMVESFDTPKFIIARPMLQPGKGSTPPKTNEYLQYSELHLEAGSNLDIILEAKEHGQHFFMDLDDDMWNIPEDNPAYENLTGENRERWIDDANASDGVICSTWHIWYSAQKSRLRVPLYICHNSVDWWNYPVVPYENKPLRLAWFGVMSHRWGDLEPYVRQIKRALKGLRSRVEFWHVGADYNSGLQLRELLRPFPVDIIERPWTDDFADIVTEIDCAIIPARDIPFNHGRSNALGLKLAAAGKPFLSSPLKEYADLEKAGIPCLTDNFEDALRDLIDDTEFRQDFRTEIPQIVERSFGPRVVAAEYTKAFESTINGAQSRVL